MTKKSFNILIDEYVSPIAVTATEEMELKEIATLMREKGFRHIPVLKGQRPVGIISDRDIALLDALESESPMTAKEVMATDPYCAYLGTSIEEVAFEMSKRKIGSALILNSNGELDGIFTSIDGLNALIEVARGDVESFN